MDESTIRKILYVVLGFILCVSLMIGIISGIFMKKNSDKTKGYKKIKGKVIEVVADESGMGDEVDYDYYVVYEYEVDGVKYTIKSNTVYELEEDADRKPKMILYNPKSPSESIVEKEKSFTLAGVIFVFNIILTIFVLGYIVAYLQYGLEGLQALGAGWIFVCGGIFLVLWSSVLGVVWSAIFMGIAFSIAGLVSCINAYNDIGGFGNVTISGKIQELKNEITNSINEMD